MLKYKKFALRGDYMNSLIFVGIFAVLYGFITSFIGNKLIDFLLMRKRYELTFQDDMYIRGKNRKFFLFVLSAISAFFMILNLEAFALAFALIFAFGMIIATRTDMEQYLIFDVWLIPCAIIGIIAVLAMNLPFKEHIFTAAALFVVTFIFAIFSKGGMGGGDVKLLAVIGLWLGYDLGLLTFVFGAVLGGVYSLFLLITKKADKGTAFPYGPFFTISALVALALCGFQY